VQREVLGLFCEPPEDAAGALCGAWRRGALSAVVEAGGGPQAAAAARAAAAAHFNAFETLDGSLALYRRCSRFNHSCAPGAEYSCLEDGRLRVRTLRPFAPGEEVRISYLGSEALLSRSTRRLGLRARYLFDCDCDRCVCALAEEADPGAAGQVLERRAAALSGRWEASAQPPELAEALRPTAEGLLREAAGLRLAPRHIIHRRLQLLCLELGVAGLAWRAGSEERAPPPADEGAGEAHGELRRLLRLWDEVLAWLRTPGRPLEHCWGIFLAEVGFALLELLTAEGAKAHFEAEAEQIGALMQDWAGNASAG